MTTTTTARYRAQTDPSTKTVHIGSASRDNVCLCGIKLITADDTRPFALKVPADQRHYTTGPDLATATCRACKRSYAKVTAAPLAEAAAERGADNRVIKAERPSRRRKATGDPRADRAAADRAADADRAAVEPRRRPSRADRAHARQEEDRARREAAAEAAE